MSNIEVVVSRAEFRDLGDILEIQRKAFLENAERYGNYEIEPLTQSLSELEHQFSSGTIFLKAVTDKRIIGSIRGFTRGDICHISKLVVSPDHQNKGVGKRLIKSLEKHFSTIPEFQLYTGNKDSKNLALYRKMGYRKFKETSLEPGVSFIFMNKRG